MDSSVEGPYNKTAYTKTSQEDERNIGNFEVEYDDKYRKWTFEDDGNHDEDDVVDNIIGNCPIEEPQVPVDPEVEACDNWYQFTKAGAAQKHLGGFLKDSIGPYAINSVKHKWSIFKNLCGTDPQSDPSSEAYGGNFKDETEDLCKYKNPGPNFVSIKKNSPCYTMWL